MAKTYSGFLLTYCSRFLGVLLWLAGISGEIYGQDTLKVFIYAGQSNAQGTNKNKNTFTYPSDSIDSQIKYAWNLAGGKSILQNGWERLQPAPLNNSRVSHAGEIAFGREVFEAGIEGMGIIKVTKAGTSINVPWDPEGNSSRGDGNGHGGMYRLLVNYAQEKLSVLEEQGIPYKVEALLWHQGERDATPEASATYEYSLNKFIDSLRQDLSPGLQVYLASIYNPKKDPASVIRIREAQMNLATQKERVYFVDLDSVYFNSAGKLNPDFMYDNIHYNSEGYIEVGRTFAQSYLLHRSEKADEGELPLCESCETYNFPTLPEQVLQAQPRLSISPNPSRASFNLDIHFEGSREVQIRLLNSLGQEVSAFKTLTSKKLQVGENFSRGVYWLVWKDRQNQGTLKLVKTP